MGLNRFLHLLVCFCTIFIPIYLFVGNDVQAFDETYALNNYSANGFAYYQTLENGDVEYYTNPNGCYMNGNWFSDNPTIITVPAWLSSYKYIILGSRRTCYYLISNTEITLSSYTRASQTYTSNSPIYSGELFSTTSSFKSTRFYNDLSNLLYEFASSDGQDTVTINDSYFYPYYTGSRAYPLLYLSNQNLICNNYSTTCPLFISSSYRDIQEPFFSLSSSLLQSYTDGYDTLTISYNGFSSPAYYLELYSTCEYEGKTYTNTVLASAHFTEAENNVALPYASSYRFDDNNLVGIYDLSKLFNSSFETSPYTSSGAKNTITLRGKFPYNLTSYDICSLSYTVGDSSSPTYTDDNATYTPDNIDSTGGGETGGGSGGETGGETGGESGDDSNQDYKDLLNKQDEIIEQQKEQNETSKGIWGTLKELLDYLNPFSENWFVFKLLDLLWEGLKSLFIPSADFFGNWFSDLNDSLRDQFGLLYYPVSCVIEFLNTLNASVAEKEPIIHIPEFSFDFMGSHAVFFADYTYNFNDLLVNENFRKVHDLYLFFVNVIFTVGLIVFAGKVATEIFGGIDDTADSLIYNSESNAQARSNASYNRQMKARNGYYKNQSKGVKNR